MCWSISMLIFKVIWALSFKFSTVFLTRTKIKNQSLLTKKETAHVTKFTVTFYSTSFLINTQIVQTNKQFQDTYIFLFVSFRFPPLSFQAVRQSDYCSVRRLRRVVLFAARFYLQSQQNCFHWTRVVQKSHHFYDRTTITAALTTPVDLFMSYYSFKYC